MVGSSQSIATPNTYLNVAVAQVLSEFADKLEGAKDKHEAIQTIVKDSYNAHKRVVFNGNGYTDEWVREAERRGLPNVKNAVDALAVLIHPETLKLFEDHKVLSREESESRYHIYLEKYAKQINIEAGVTIDLARRYIFPAASRYSGKLAKIATQLANIGANSGPQEKRAKRLAGLTAELFEETDKLESALIAAQETEGVVDQAKVYFQKVRPAMDSVRSRGDQIEKLVAKDFWPMPGYEEMLFKL
ncbi:hypothetical protein FACS1894164_21370 [Spirochaetia bacterium]|nr:hypothetical protein FACS1894164_21370 [Spirochaetia bacterium]